MRPWDEIQVLLTGPVVVADVVPGLLLCVPGSVFAGAFVLVPLVLLVRAHRRRTGARPVQPVTRSFT